jgi:hypothetical protein
MDRHTGQGGFRTPLILLLMLAALGVWLLAAAGPAAAIGPSEPTMSLTDLQTAITSAGSGGLDGYFKTVLQGDTVSIVSVKILAVADGQNATDGSTMILFQITDPTVLAQGGVAEGMSGSPLFVGDYENPRADDPLVGAVSQGDIFTEQGLGLATPIDFMESIEQNYQVTVPAGVRARAQSALPAALEVAGPVLPKTRTAAPDHAVRTTVGRLHTLVMARSLAVARALHPKVGTAVFVPLSTLEVGGLPAASPAFKRLAAAFAKRGVDVQAAGAGAGDDPAFSTPLVEGASVAAVLSSGAVWAAYVGTVTYVDTADNVVLAFGHPADYDGPVALDMANAWVSGIWSDSYVPYKLVSLGADQGVITQDRAYGIAGEIGPTNIEVPIDASAAIGTTTPTEFDTFVPQWVADNPNYGEMVVSAACYWAVYKVTDALSYAGHATMDSQVTVNDSLVPGQTYTADLPNVFDDPIDVGGYAGMDAATMLATLLSNPGGTAPATAKSVTFSADLTPTHATMQILDFSVPGGLKHGANTVQVITRAYGETGTREEDLTLDIPTGVETSGAVTVYDSNGLNPGSGSGSSLPLAAPRLGSNVTPATTLSDLVNEVDATPLNDSLNVTLVADVPNQFVVPTGPDGVPENYITASEAVTDGGTTWYVRGNLTKQTASMHLYASPSATKPGRTVTLMGVFDAQDASGTTVTIYRGTSTTPYATNVPVVVTPDGMAQFVVRAKVLSKKNTRFTAVWDGSDSYIGATASRTVRVRK